MSETPERIAAAAVRFNGLTASLPIPARHGDIMRRLDVPAAPSDQGFITSTGRFVSRHEATVIAVRCGQLNKDPAYPPEHYSEDLW
jgi:hypothetical protein